MWKKQKTRTMHPVTHNTRRQTPSADGVTSIWVAPGARRKATCARCGCAAFQRRSFSRGYTCMVCGRVKAGE